MKIDSRALVAQVFRPALIGRPEGLRYFKDTFQDIFRVNPNPKYNDKHFLAKR
jgi:hypothetical protein